LARTAPFLGMVGTQDWETNQTPKNYREEILWLDPNGTAPLLAISSRARKGEALDNGDFNYYVNILPERGGALAGSCVYLDPALTTPYVTGGVAGDTLYLKMVEALPTGWGHSFPGEAIVGEFREGQHVVIRYSEEPAMDVNARVTAVVPNGAASYIAVKLLEADDNSGQGNDLSDADYVYIIGNANPEGGYSVDPINYLPVSVNNHTQIFKNSLMFTGSDLETKLRTAKDKAAKMKQKRFETRLLHMLEMEMAFYFSKLGSRTASNGELEWSMMGVFEFIGTYASQNISDYRYAAAYSGKTWLEKGEDWINESLNANFKYKPRGEVAPMDRLGFIALDGLQALNRLALASGQQELRPKQTSFGIQVVDWYCSGGVVHFIVNPIFNQNVTLNKTALIYHPKNFEYVWLRNRDTKREDVTPTGFDGIKEQYMTECSARMYNAPMWSILHGLGELNVV